MFDLDPEVLEAHADPFQDVRAQLVDVVHGEDIKHQLEQHPHPWLMLVSFEDFFCSRNELNRSVINTSLTRLGAPRWYRTCRAFSMLLMHDFFEMAL